MILVVGGTGFIGKTLLLHLAELGLSAATVSRNPQRRFLDTHLPQVRVLTPQALRKRPKRLLSQLTGCVYLASAGRLGDHRETPWREAERMLAPLMRMLHIVSDGVPAPVPIVYVSSAAVYGRQSAPLLSEALPPQPISPYGTGKVMAETAVAAAGRQSGCPVRILRPSTPIGRWQAGAARGVVGILMDAAQSGAAFRMNGDGSAERDYFDARDLARAIVAALRPDGPAYGLWNVGSGQGVPLSALLAEVEAVTGQTILVEQQPMPTGEVSRAVLDVRRIAEDLGWRAEIPLRSALEDIWAARA